MPARAVSDPAGKRKKNIRLHREVQADVVYLDLVASSSRGMDSGKQARISSMAPK